LAQEKIPDLTNVRIIARHVSGSVYMLEATGDVAGNIAASIGPDGVLLVDTQFAPLAGKIREALKKIGGTDIRFVINTHYHLDHAHGDADLAARAVLIAHKNARRRMAARGDVRLPDITIDRKISLHFNGENIRILPMPPGHTDNDVVVFFETSAVVHVGDLWNSGISSFPTVDLEAGGNVDGMLADVNTLIGMIPENAWIIPGHCNNRLIKLYKKWINY
jgi:glyoxylase-like metal-dependent hydrolase (beta-lactamase superfamily II)